jgi:hypothetical protein
MDLSTLDTLLALSGPVLAERLVALWGSLENAGELHDSTRKLNRLLSVVVEHVRHVPPDERHQKALRGAYRRTWDNLSSALAARRGLGRLRRWLMSGRRRHFCDRANTLFDRLEPTLPPARRRTLWPDSLRDLRRALAENVLDELPPLESETPGANLPDALRQRGRATILLVAAKLDAGGHAALAELLRRLDGTDADFLPGAFAEAFREALRRDADLAHYLDARLEEASLTLLRQVREQTRQIHQGLEAAAARIDLVLESTRQIVLGQEQTEVQLEATREVVRERLDALQARLEDLTGGQVPPAIGVLAGRAEALAREQPPLAGRIRAEVLDLLGQTELVVAVVGEFGSGKSSLIDCLLGEELLPVGVMPTTAVPVEVRHGPPMLHRGRDLLLDPAAFAPLARAEESLATGERLRASRPQPWLRGLCLIDTPGLQAPGWDNEAVVSKLLPDVHAVLVVIDATRGVPRTLADFLRDRLWPCQPARLVFAVNRCDLVTAADRPRLLSYVTDALRGVLGGTPQVVASSTDEPAGVEPVRQVLIDLAAQRWQVLLELATARLEHLAR